MENSVRSQRMKLIVIKALTIEQLKLNTERNMHKYRMRTEQGNRALND